MQRGIFIALEGIDGSGKTTQLQALAARLEAAGYDVAKLDFPRYSQPSSYFIKQFLNGAYGGIGDVNPYAASLFYALDRYEAGPEICKLLDAGKTIITDRFSGSNLAHQGAKIANQQERAGFYIWLDNLEFEILGIPRPTLSIVLQTSADAVQTLMDQRAPRDYTDKKRDIHEADASHLDRTARVYSELAQLFPQDFQVIDCLRGGQLLDPATITERLWNKVQPLLPASPKPPPMVFVPDTRTVQPAMRQAGISVLAELSLLRQHAVEESVPVVVPQLAANWFYTPPALPPALRDSYAAAMNEAYACYVIAVQRLRTQLQQSQPSLSPGEITARAQAAAQLILPLATLVNVGSSTLPADISEPALVTIGNNDAAVRAIADTSLPANHADQSEAVKLTGFWPRSELDLVPQILYQFSDRSLELIKREVGKWPHAKKVECLRAYAAAHTDDTGPSLLDNVHYSWDLVTDVATFRALAPLASSLTVQPLSPRLGYDIPELVEQAGLSDVFESCFDASLALYSLLQAAGLATEARYAALLGHRLRWTLQLDWPALAEILNQHNMPNTTIQAMANLAAKRHPLVARPWRLVAPAPKIHV